MCRARDAFGHWLISSSSSSSWWLRHCQFWHWPSKRNPLPHSLQRYSSFSFLAADPILRDGESFSDYLNDRLQTNYLFGDKLGDAKTAAAALSRAITTRLEVEPRTRQTIGKLVEASPQPPENYYSDYVRKLLGCTNQSSVPQNYSLEEMASLDATALLKDLAWVSSLRGVRFSSEGEVEVFVDRLRGIDRVVRFTYDAKRLDDSHSWLEEGFRSFIQNSEERMFTPIR